MATKRRIRLQNAVRSGVVTRRIHSIRASLVQRSLLLSALSRSFYSDPLNPAYRKANILRLRTRNSNFSHFSIFRRYSSLSGVTSQARVIARAKQLISNSVHAETAKTLGRQGVCRIVYIPQSQASWTPTMNLLVLHAIGGETHARPIPRVPLFGNPRPDWRPPFT